jgi:hypothetical protein
MLQAAIALVLLGAPAHRLATPTDSVIHDSIYALAVNPSDFPKQSVVYLLDEGVYRIEPDGRGARTIRQVIQILKTSGAAQYREQRLSYDPNRQRLVVNWMRVVRPNGQVVSAEPSQVQESDVAAPMGVPMYTSMKVKRMSLTGVDSGTVFDYSYTLEDLKSPMPGDFFYAWRVTTPVPVQRSLLVVDVPKGFLPRIEEKNLNFRRTEQTIGGRTIYRWATDKVPPIVVEPFAPDSSLKVGTVTVSPPFGWDAIGKWYAPIAAAHYALTPAVTEKIHQVVSNAKTLDDSVRAIHKWVSSDIRYVAIELGPSGGYVPRDAATVAQTGFGDCKDKTMLFLAALRSIGVTGYPVLLNPVVKVDEDVPYIGAFNHMIAAVQTAKGYVFTDLTASGLPYGRLVPTEHGRFGLVIRDQAAEITHLPGSVSPEQRDDIRITGTVTADGTFEGVMEESGKGNDAGLGTLLLVHPPDSAQKAMLARSMAGSVFEGAEADSLTFTTSPDSSGAYTIRLRIHNAKITSEAGNLELMSNPIHGSNTPAGIAQFLQQAGKRTLPIDVAKISPRQTSHYEADITLPAGWHAILPKNFSSPGLVGQFDVTYAQVGNELRITRVNAPAKGVVGPDRIQDVIAALKQLSSAVSRTIPVQPQ